MNGVEAELFAVDFDSQYRVGQREEEMLALIRDFRIDRVTLTVMGKFVT